MDTKAFDTRIALLAYDIASSRVIREALHQLEGIVKRPKTPKDLKIDSDTINHELFNAIKGDL